MSDEVQTRIQLAALTERVSNLTVAVESLVSLHKGLADTVATIPVMQRDIIELTAKTERAFSSIKTANEKITENTTAITEYKTTSKIVTALIAFGATVALGVSSWSWGQLDKLHETDGKLDYRLTAIEIRQQMRDQGIAKNDVTGH
jgi:HAMP domain-containing protein